MPLLTPSSNHSNPGRPELAVARVVSMSLRTTRTDEVSVWGPHFARDESGRVLRWDEVRPTAHIFYGTRLLDIDDDLGKWEGYEGTSDKIA